MTLTKREQFAMAALQGLLASPHFIDPDGLWTGNGAEPTAEAAVILADALISALYEDHNEVETVEADWISWHGGRTCPVDEKMKVEVRLRNGMVLVGFAGEFVWSYYSVSSDIVSYRIIED